ncbi:MAG: glutathione S-transferase family protein [Rhodanobacteraceae bacterium]
MDLLYTANSPYARVARTCALELAIKVEFLLVAVRDAADLLLEYNPAGKVPSLQLDDGRVLGECRLICEHFASIAGTRFTAPVTDLDGRCREGLVSGFLDGVAVWVREARRDRSEQSPGILRLEHERARRCLAHFEQHWEAGSVHVDYASVALASAIGLVDSRLQTEWRQRCPKLVRWFETISDRPSLRATAPLQV